MKPSEHKRKLEVLHDGDKLHTKKQNTHHVTTEPKPKPTSGANTSVGANTSGTSITKNVADRIQMRNYVLMLVGDACGRRGGEIRDFKPSLMMVRELPDVGPAKCSAIAISIRKFKEGNSSSAHNELLTGFMRHKNRLQCPIGALAAYLVWLNDLSVDDMGKSTLMALQKYMTATKEWIKAGKPKNTKPTPEWKRHYLFYGINPQRQISYSTHRSDVERLRDAAGISGKGASVHLSRSDIHSKLMEKGMPLLDIQGFGHWGSHTEAVETYLKAAFPAGTTAVIADWDDLKSYNCSWEGNIKDIPSELQNQVFTGCDDILKMAHKANRVTNTHDYDAEVIACEFYVYMRKVFLEDAVYKHDRYAEVFPAYKHPVFNSTLWKIYKIEEANRVSMREAAFCNANPNEILKQIRDGILNPATKSEPVKTATKQKPPKKHTQGPNDITKIAEALLDEEEEKAAQNVMPNVLEPDDLHKSYQQYCDVWRKEKERSLNWEDWFPLSVADKIRYHRCVNMYRYIYTHTTKEEAEAVEAATDSTKTKEKEKDLIDKLYIAAKATKSNMREFVKNCIYFYYHPPKKTDKKHAPKHTQDDIDKIFKDVGLPPL